ncbi:MAG TPA: SMI1/KNR4 family protein [Isosphaeraceae bacterium]|nr:SMI1/KNR4 family protein [Isosphaeraceae bacterium]
MSVEAISPPLADIALQWTRSVGIDPGSLPEVSILNAGFARSSNGACRPPADSALIDSWEQRHGYRLPQALRAWLLLSDGLYGDLGPIIHPLTAIGPMIPFAKVPGLVVQPESWFELGNPDRETICIDLAYQWPRGDCPIFTSGDDETGSPPRLIAPSFEGWLARLLREGGRPYWFDPGFPILGHPWLEHRRHTPVPPLPDRLKSLAPRLVPLLGDGADDRAIASALGVSRSDVELMFRHLQHAMT